MFFAFFPLGPGLILSLDALLDETLHFYALFNYIMYNILSSLAKAQLNWED